jgi:hypothetical protein
VINLFILVAWLVLWFRPAERLPGFIDVAAILVVAGASGKPNR